MVTHFEIYSRIKFIEARSAVSKISLTDESSRVNSKVPTSITGCEFSFAALIKNYAKYKRQKNLIGKRTAV